MSVELTSPLMQSCISCGALPYEVCVNSNGDPLTHCHNARSKAENDAWMVRYDELYRDNTIKRFDLYPYSRKRVA